MRLAGTSVVVEYGAIGKAPTTQTKDFDSAAKNTLSPPLRSAAHVAALQQGLARGLLHLVGSDHASFNTTQKRLGREDFRDIPVSGNGIEERMVVTYDAIVASGLARRK